MGREARNAVRRLGTRKIQGQTGDQRCPQSDIFIQVAPHEGRLLLLLFELRACWLNLNPLTKKKVGSPFGEPQLGTTRTR